ncbi:MAG: hypothetical protein WAT19_00530 [Ferruginibacter sp.]
MPQVFLKQLQYESDAWKRLLSFITDENIHLKNRLSVVLKEHFSDHLLEGIEVFQNSFVKEDELVSILRNEVSEFDRLLVREVFEDGKIAREVRNSAYRLRNNISVAEKQFGKLKMAFHSYLSENLNYREEELH